MKFRVERDALADAIAWTAKSLPTRPSVPVLAGVLMRVAEGQLTVSGFDYEVSSQVTVGVQADSDGAALVSGKLLAEITKALPAKPVEVAGVGTHLEVVCGSARFTLPTMPVEDYPTLPSMPEMAGVIDASAFAHAVAQVAIAAGRDDTIPMLTGVRMELEGSTLSLLATDRYRAAVRELTWRPMDDGINIQALVPARTLADTAKTLGPIGGEVTVALSRGGIGEGMIGFAGGSRRTTSRLLDPDFPKIRSLFPDQHQARARLNVALLTEVVKRVALVADRTTPVRLSFAEGEVVIEAGSSEDARASEAMEAEFTGEALTVAFNPGYLLDGLAVLDAPTVLVSFTTAMKPAVISPAGDDGEPIPGYRYLIMPMRVGN
ncbi:MAG: polymerase subunit beta [Micromonosporaceae bacterium]|nr:polymerase subunit beta [Micromonosporaceae bacterium]